MKKFLSKNLLFVIILIFMIITVFCIESIFMRNNLRMKINENEKYIVLGHSHSECAFNDSLIANFRNLSSSGESYLYTYQKVKKIFIENPKIETVFIEFTNNVINIEMDNWIWGDTLLTDRYPKYSFLMDFDDQLLLFTNNFYGFVKGMSLSLKNNFYNIIYKNYDFSNKMGGYLYLDRNKTDSLVMIIKKKDLDIEYTNNEISINNLNYLKKIIDLSKKHKKDIYLIRSPQHHLYSGLDNEKKFKRVRETYFSSIDFLDFNEFPLKNKEFGDLEHLNYKGARVFSLWFDSLIKDNLLKKFNKKQIIDEKIKRLKGENKVVIAP